MSILLIIIILIIILFFMLIVRNVEYDMLCGFWSGDPYFCEDSELDLFLIYIDNTPGNKKNGYIMMKNENGLIINNPVILNLNNSMSVNPFVRDVIEFDLEIDWLYEEGYDFFSSKQKMLYYPKQSKMILSSNGETMGLLYKDCSMSDNNLNVDNMNDSESI